jgi:hypothetical protein
MTPIVSQTVRFFLAAAILAGGTSHALAQTGAEVPERFIVISDDLLIDGELRRPSGDLFVGRSDAEFSPLFTARRSFIDEIVQSAEELTH